MNDSVFPLEWSSVYKVTFALAYLLVATFLVQFFLFWLCKSAFIDGPTTAVVVESSKQHAMRLSSSGVRALLHAVRTSSCFHECACLLLSLQLTMPLKNFPIATACLYSVEQPVQNAWFAAHWISDTVQQGLQPARRKGTCPPHILNA